MHNAENKGRIRLHWPWNVVALIAVAVILGYFIGYLWSILLAVFLSRFIGGKRKGMPEGGYCLDRTRKRLVNVLWGVILLALGALFLIFGVVSFQDGEMVYAVMGIGLGTVVVLLSIYEICVSVRDTLFPEKSRLANSIRSQLPYPDEAPPAAELFARVDRDIEENGQWFDRVAVGREWILGDDVSFIPRIRAVFGRDEIKTHRSKNHTHSQRIVQLYIMDDRRQVQVTGLRDPRELPPLLECIRLRAPEALIRPYKEFDDYSGKSDEEWQALELEYRRKKGNREAEQSQAPREWEQNITLTKSDGSATSRLEPKMLLELLEKTAETFTLTAGRPVDAGKYRLSELSCTPAGGERAELFVREAPEHPGSFSDLGWRTSVSRLEARHILEDWLRGKAPCLKEWEPMFLSQPAKKQEGGVQSEKRGTELALESSHGAFQRHERFTREDVLIAAEGIADGSCRQVDLTLPGGYLWMRARFEGEEGTVLASRLLGEQLQILRTRCGRRQASEWLIEFFDGQFFPDWNRWEDCTEEE